MFLLSWKAYGAFAFLRAWPEFTAEIKLATGKPFNSGKDQRRAQGGAREGAGRPSNEFRELCAEALKDVQGIDFVKSLVAGVKFDGPFGMSPAKPETRFEAVKWLAERAYGKAVQPVSGEDGGPITIKVVSYGNNGSA